MKISKSVKAVGFSVVFVAAICAVAFTTVKVADELSKSGKSGGKCGDGSHTAYMLTIKDDHMIPEHLDAKLCDTLTIKNTDDRSRLMAFGKHDRHEPYDGVSERYLLKDESFTVTLNQAGSFLVHDHHEDEVQATFSVSQ